MSTRDRLPIKRRDLSAFWQSALVLAPLLLLAVLGVRGLQLSKRATLDRARAECERPTSELLQRFLQALPALARECAVPTLYPEAPVPAAANDAQALFRTASLQPVDASAIWERLAEDDRDALAESGVPLLPLVCWAQLRNASSPAEGELFAEKLARAAVETHPSVLTPELLARAAQLLAERGSDADPLSAWRTRWQQDERARIVLRRNAARIATKQTPLWLDGADERWWMEGDGEGMVRVLIPKSRLVSLVHALVNDGSSPLPAYASARVTLGGVALTQNGDDGLRLSHLENGPLVVSAVLTDPGKLYAQQLVQGLWLAALLACALAAALAGFWVLRRALARERQLGEMKSNFVASVSHELRAPIASMRVMAENLESGVVREEARRGEYHRLISEECRRLSTVIDNVLDFARIEQNQKTYHFAETDVPALVRDGIELMQPRAAQRAETIAAELEPLDPPPCCDSLAVQQALINLLDNAIKFSPEKSATTVRLCRRSADEWELSVSDSGPGIPGAEHAKIFERFYRIGSELCRETQGAGIGLSIVKHIVEAHAGRIAIESEPGAGARFTLIFPQTPSCRAS